MKCIILGIISKFLFKSAVDKLINIRFKLNYELKVMYKKRKARHLQVSQGRTQLLHYNKRRSDS